MKELSFYGGVILELASLWVSFFCILLFSFFFFSLCMVFSRTFFFFSFHTVKQRTIFYSFLVYSSLPLSAFFILIIHPLALLFLLFLFLLPSPFSSSSLHSYLNCLSYNILPYCHDINYRAWNGRRRVEKRARNCALLLVLRFCLHVLGFLGVSLSLQLSILHLSEVSYLYHLFPLWSHLLDTILISSCMVY